MGLSVGGGSVGGAWVGSKVGTAVDPVVECGVGEGTCVRVGGGAVQVTAGSFVLVGSVESSGIVSRPVGSVPATGNAPAAEAILAVAVVAQSIANGDVDAANRIDDLDEARQVHLRPAIDADIEQGTERGREDGLARYRAGELARVLIGV